MYSIFVWKGVLNMAAEMLELMKSKAVTNKNGILTIPFFFCREVARECGISVRDSEIFALESGICPSRYERNIGTLGLEGQIRLLQARVAVAGCGGLGGWIIEMLARAGVGEIVMVDGDVFDDNNLNRQLFSCEENLGVNKAETAARRVRMINAAVTPYPKAMFVNEENGMEIFKGCSAVVDALDSNSARRAAFKTCRELNIPYIHGAVAGFFGQSGVFYPDNIPIWDSGDVPDRGIESETGNLAFTPAFIASVEVSETIKILAGFSEKLQRSTLFWFNLENMDIQKIKI